MLLILFELSGFGTGQAIFGLFFEEKVVSYWLVDR
jgi:hypothetical protein